MRKYFIYIILVVLVVLNSCATTSLTKLDAFPRMYSEAPLSIAVAPPINQVSAADASEFYLSTIAEPFVMHGYYIFPIPVVADILKDEGAYNTLQEIPQPDVAKKMNQLFGADATLFARIQKWDKKYRVTSGSVTVLIDYQLVSGKTGDMLWSHAQEVIIDTSGDSGGGGGIAGLVIKAVTTAIKTATTDYVPIARQANYFAMVAFPFGKYNPMFGLDKAVKVTVFKSKAADSGGAVEPAKTGTDAAKNTKSGGAESKTKRK
jgi:hypothetical protein